MTNNGIFRCLYIALALSVACFEPAYAEPGATESMPFVDRALSETANGIRVAIVVPGADESKSLFGVDLYRRSIQPVWLRVENGNDEPVWFVPASVDPDYLTPLDVAAVFKGRKAGRELAETLRERSMGLYIAPGTSRSGFIFTNVDEGSKPVVVDVLGPGQGYSSFMFVVPVPGLRVDHYEIDFESMFSEDEFVDYDEDGLRKALENLPCCTTDKNGKRQGDPLNIVVIGEPGDVYRALIRAGWDETETIYRRSMLKTAKSFVFGGEYRYSPISALYVFGRPQDAALQKARDTIHERNHLRLWMTPMRIDSTPVWIGQISRDIGVRFTKRTITTHKIDPDVDESRTYLLQDLWYNESLTRYGHVGGVISAPIDAPRSNLTGDPYFTDGLRVVLWLSGKPVNMEAVENLEWELMRGR